MHDNAIINLTLDASDDVKPCPFCGAGRESLELCNTHTPYYWIACQCAAEVHGLAYSVGRHGVEGEKRQHALAKKSALEAWNRRA
jgi:hypothetical protein